MLGNRCGEFFPVMSIGIDVSIYIYTIIYICTIIYITIITNTHIYVDMYKISWKPSTDSPAAKVTPSSMMVLDRRMALQNGSATPLEGQWRPVVGTQYVFQRPSGPQIPGKMMNLKVTWILNSSDGGVTSK